jgi:hypothetical protein
MAMPWQLREGLKRRPKGKFPPRPIAEQLPSVNVNDLQIPRDHRTYVAPNISLRYPFLAGARLSWDAIEALFPGNGTRVSELGPFLPPSAVRENALQAAL